MFARCPRPHAPSARSCAQVQQHFCLARPLTSWPKDTLPLKTCGTRRREACVKRLLEAESAEDRLAVLESALAARLPRVRSLHPAIASVIDEMHSLQSVEAAVQQSGISHRQFIAQFRRAVGLAPKAYLRVLRFQRALQSLRQGKVISLVSLAAEAGYSDQAHFNRDFMEFTGVTPTTYQRLSPCESNHLPVDQRPSRRP